MLREEWPQTIGVDTMPTNSVRTSQCAQEYSAILTGYILVANSAGSHMHDMRVHTTSQCLEHPPFRPDRMKPHEYSSIQGEDPITKPSIQGDDVHFGISLLDCQVGNKGQDFLDLSER